MTIAMMNQTRQQTKYCLGLASQSSKNGNNSNYINNNNNNNNNSNNYNYSNYNNSNGNEEDDAAFEKMRKDIEANQDSALSLCTEKVLLARQAYDLVPFFFLFKMHYAIGYSIFYCHYQHVDWSKHLDGFKLMWPITPRLLEKWYIFFCLTHVKPVQMKISINLVATY
ncbi:hypothetical protein ACB092_03G239900 [Castanea dentata]